MCHTEAEALQGGHVRLMPTSPSECANYELNQQMCPCTNTGCANHGICCECLQNHVKYGVPTACMNSAPRPEATLKLVGKPECRTNGARNAGWCVCSSTSCSRRGVCCNCVRHHWTLDGTGRVACMRNVG